MGVKHKGLKKPLDKTLCEYILKFGQDKGCDYFLDDTFNDDGSRNKGLRCLYEEEVEDE